MATASDNSSSSRSLALVQTSVTHSCRYSREWSQCCLWLCHWDTECRGLSTHSQWHHHCSTLQHTAQHAAVPGRLGNEPLTHHSTLPTGKTHSLSTESFKLGKLVVIHLGMKQ